MKSALGCKVVFGKYIELHALIVKQKSVMINKLSFCVRATITKYLKLSGLKRQKFFVLQF